jgi:hypothetical protein
MADRSTHERLQIRLQDFELEDDGRSVGFSSVIKPLLDVISERTSKKISRYCSESRSKLLVYYCQNRKKREGMDQLDDSAGGDLTCEEPRSAGLS